MKYKVYYFVLCARMHPRNRWRNQKFRPRVPRPASRNDAIPSGCRDDRWTDVDGGVPVSAVVVVDNALLPGRSHAVAPVG